jgi:high frequency lysogenization protein
MRPETDRVLALAGVFQAALLTQQAAREGRPENVAATASLESVFRIDAESVPAVFGGPGGVALGLQELVRQLAHPGRQRVEVARYALSLLQLERKLAADPRRLEAIGDGLQVAASHRTGDAPVTDPEPVAALAEIYREQVSTVSPRIMVQGDPTLLQRPETGARIRAFLLAGIRAARLWHQCGGRRWHLFVRRRTLTETARRVLRTIDEAGTGAASA